MTFLKCAEMHYKKSEIYSLKQKIKHELFICVLWKLIQHNIIKFFNGVMGNIISWDGKFDSILIKENLSFLGQPTSQRIFF